MENKTHCNESIVHTSTNQHFQDEKMNRFSKIVIKIFITVVTVTFLCGIWHDGGISFWSLVWLDLGIALAILPTAELILCREFGGLRRLPGSAIDALFFAVPLTVAGAMPVLNIMIVFILFVKLYGIDEGVNY